MERGWIGMFRRTQKAAMPKSMAHISLGWIKMGAGAGARKALNPPATKAYARKGSGPLRNPICVGHPRVEAAHQPPA